VRFPETFWFWSSSFGVGKNHLPRLWWVEAHHFKTTWWWIQNRHIYFKVFRVGLQLEKNNYGIKKSCAIFKSALLSCGACLNIIIIWMTHPTHSCCVYTFFFLFSHEEVIWYYIMQKKMKMKNYSMFTVRKVNTAYHLIFLHFWYYFHRKKWRF